MSGSTPNANYFWDLVVFKVEDELFKVPKQRFVENPHPPFNEMFTLLQPQGSESGPLDTKREEGRSADHPIVLEQIAKVDFERFLGALYPRVQPLRRKACNTEIYTATWLSVLKISSLWNFIEIRKAAIERLFLPNVASFNIFDRILAGQDYGVLKWFIEGIMIVVSAHKADLDHKDARRIGINTAISLYHLKNKMRDAVQRMISPYTETREQAIRDVLSKGITEYFLEEIRDIGSKEAVYYEMSEEKLVEGAGDGEWPTESHLSVEGFGQLHISWSVNDEPQIIIY
ncbi:hypothetical protein PQX77_016759 [Marasmius sp. AFHP31]|nr:hypothetical protein PQX77_016759 [Marasmius sp. AFHP31]